MSRHGRLGRSVPRRPLVNGGVWLIVALLFTAGIGVPEAFGWQPGGVTLGGDTASTANLDEAANENGPIPDTNLLNIVKDGGVLMFPILFCSFVLLMFVFERSISLRRGRVIPRPFVKRFLHQLREGELDEQSAMELCEQNNSPVARVFAGALRKWGRPAVEVEQAVLDSGERVVNSLRRYLRIFNGIATVSPLLGLLGTVLGMIQAFNAIATTQAMGRPELLAGGISQALLTTAAGLSVAIPALIFYLFFVSRVDQLTIEIDALGQEAVDGISAEGLAGQKPTATKTRRRQAAA